MHLSFNTNKTMGHNIEENVRSRIDYICVKSTHCTINSYSIRQVEKEAKIVLRLEIPVMLEKLLDKF